MLRNRINRCIRVFYRLKIAHKLNGDEITIATRRRSKKKHNQHGYTQSELYSLANGLLMMTSTAIIELRIAQINEEWNEVNGCAHVNDFFHRSNINTWNCTSLIHIYGSNQVTIIYNCLETEADHIVKITEMRVYRLEGYHLIVVALEYRTNKWHYMFHSWAS